ncbi:MAG: hypothetical protein CO189_11110 [candidate division Zixibacteria bacterium CG_4_9_14_3_um_filter_46_8]|nr:MAG: hypothetical protein CO189_11110 [candidate division Zixibacteria bacterium CG_4_9_14_3_um_filter_46_8]
MGKDVDARRYYIPLMYIITNEEKKFRQVLNSFPELDRRYINVLPDQIGLLYSSEMNPIKLREAFDL